MGQQPGRPARIATIASVVSCVVAVAALFLDHPDMVSEAWDHTVQFIQQPSQYIGIYGLVGLLIWASGLWIVSFLAAIAFPEIGGMGITIPVGLVLWGMLRESVPLWGVVLIGFVATMIAGGGVTLREWLDKPGNWK